MHCCFCFHPIATQRTRETTTSCDGLGFAYLVYELAVPEAADEFESCEKERARGNGNPEDDTPPSWL